VNPRTPPSVQGPITALAQGDTMPHPRWASTGADRATQPRRVPTGSVWQHSDSEPPVVTVDAEPTTGPRYEERRVLGRGGMGEVLLTRDAWLGREVALKRLRDDVGAGTDGMRRFVHEARVQGQLEHPSVVPVYDLAVGDAGGPHFTMKRVQGLTLRDVLERLRARDADAMVAFSRRKLLVSLSQVCLALAYAHARGVVHRDLKPENLMLGEFGEVYVLDWGVAKLGAIGAEEPASSPATALEAIAAPPSGSARTQVGDVIGTPGYMAPEQARGESHRVGPEADLYALGAILYELVTLEPLHDGLSAHALLVSTLRCDGARPSAIAPDVPPELDALCYAATRLEPSDRIRSARALATSLERYLDGERDVERRAELAREHLTRAEEALRSALRGGADADAERARGLQELGRALALDPTQGAVSLLSQVVLDARDELIPEAAAELRSVQLADRAKASERAAWLYGGMQLVAGVGIALGLRAERPLAVQASIVAGLVLGLAALYNFWMARTGRTEPRFMRPAIVLNFLATGMMSLWTGPALVLPMVALLGAASFIVSLRANAMTRRFITLLAIATVAVPYVIDLAGWGGRTMTASDGVLHIASRALWFAPIATPVLLLATTVGVLLANALLVGHAVESMTAAERRNLALAHRLRQLLPSSPGTKPSERPSEAGNPALGSGTGLE